MCNATDVTSLLSAARPVTIELGCGPVKRVPGSIGIDIIAYEGVDLVGDVFEVLPHFPDSSVHRVVSSHFLEHVDDLEQLMEMLARIVRVGGSLELIVPHFSNPFYYSDPTHRRPFGLYTFSYLFDDNLFRRKVPRYGVAPKFALESVSIEFKSYRPNYLRHGLKRLVGWIVNRTTWTQELYEENLSWIVPAYELHYFARRTAP